MKNKNQQGVVITVVITSAIAVGVFIATIVLYG